MEKINELKSNENRKIYIDILKIIAIFLVLFNHTGNAGFTLFLISKQSNFYWIYMFNSVFVKIAVPIFFMCSGALLLRKEETIKKIVFHRFIKYLIVLIVSSIIVYIYICYRLKLTDFSIINFLKTLYTKQVSGGYWYLYTYLGFILMLPFIRKLAKGMSNKEYKYMVILFFIMNVIPIIEFLIFKDIITHRNGNFWLFITTNYIFYPLIGFFIDEKLDVKKFNKKNLLIMIILSIISIIITCLITDNYCNLIGEWKESSCQVFLNNLIFIPVITVFYGIKLLFLKHIPNPKINKIIATISGTTFGIYLFEYIYTQETKNVYTFLYPYIHTLPSSLMWTFVACVVGSIITLLLKKIPIIKKCI